MSAPRTEARCLVSAGFHMSLDGYVARLGGGLDWMEFTPDMLEYATEAMRGIDTMLMGRVNFLEQAAAWPDRNSDLADAVNAHDKVVVTSRPDAIDLAAWDGTRATSDPVAEIEQLRQQPDRRIGIAGGATLLHSLMRQHLIDEIRVVTHPVTLGSGLSPWPTGLRLRLAENRAFASGATLRTYLPLRPVPHGPGV